MTAQHRLLSFALAAALLTARPAAAAGGSAVIYRHENGAHNIALTFDDGPHAVYTAEILDILAAYDICATFFVIGENAERHPELLQRALAEGHEIGNHTQTHPLRDVNEERLEQEMYACECTVGELLDRRTHLFRPPGGILLPTVGALAQRHGYRVILWSIDTRDWAHTAVPDITQNVLTHVRDGDIILMHDGIDPPSPTPAALRVIIPQLLARGFHFVTVSELLREQTEEKG